MTVVQDKLQAATVAASDPYALASEIGLPVEQWVNRCHEVSLALLKTGRFGNGRVARGWSKGIGSQHSWIVLGDDVYAHDAVIVDATKPVFHKLWVTGGREGTPILVSAGATGGTHRPHGMGDIWQAGPPLSGRGQGIRLTPKVPLSREAKSFLAILQMAGGTLDRQAWAMLSNGPMQGWPAGEIIAAIDDTEELRALVPIDILGMLTDRNPGGLYLAKEEA